MQHVWQHWSEENLRQLHHTFYKWNTSSPILKMGDIVCLRGEQGSTTQLILARVKEVHPGPDRKVRVVIV